MSKLNIDLKKLHQVELEILDEVVRICKKYKIEYFLTGGTLLGAVRHKGFIPWDDDIDIIMTRKEFNKFKEIYKIELNEKYIYQDSEVEENFIFPFAKIRKKNTKFEEEIFKNLKLSKGIFIDIFILDYSYAKNSLAFYIQEKLFKVLQRLILIKVFKREDFIKYLNSQKKIKNQIFINIFIMILNTGLKFINIKNLYKIREKIITVKKESEYYINFGTPYSLKKDIIEASIYEKNIKLEFEKRKYNSPVNYEYYLKKTYGNYMELPPLEKRKVHFVEPIIFEVR